MATNLPSCFLIQFLEQLLKFLPNLLCLNKLRWISYNEVKVFWHQSEFMSTILLNFGVHARNWQIIDFQPLEFNSEFYFWRFQGPCIAEFQQRVKIVGLYIRLKTSSRSQRIIQNNYFDWNKMYFTKKAKKKCINPISTGGGLFSTSSPVMAQNAKKRNKPLPWNLVTFPK